REVAAQAEAQVATAGRDVVPDGVAVAAHPAVRGPEFTAAGLGVQGRPGQHVARDPEAFLRADEPDVEAVGGAREQAGDRVRARGRLRGLAPVDQRERGAHRTAPAGVAANDTRTASGPPPGTATATARPGPTTSAWSAHASRQRAPSSRPAPHTRAAASTRHHQSANSRGAPSGRAASSAARPRAGRKLTSAGVGGVGTTCLRSTPTGRPRAVATAQ